MKLEFLFVPTSDLNASLALYRDSLGFTEMWREGDATVALTLPDSEVHVMLDAHDPDAPRSGRCSSSTASMPSMLLARRRSP